MSATAPARRAELRDVSLNGDRQYDGDDEIFLAGYKPILPDGKYEARYIGHETAIVFGAAKLFLHFELVEPGPHMGTRLFRPFRVRKLVGKAGKGGKFTAHTGGDLFPILARLLDVRLRKDRISLGPLRSMLFRVSTRTVTKNYRQQEIPEPARYSVIAAIERGE